MSRSAWGVPASAAASLGRPASRCCAWPKHIGAMPGTTAFTTAMPLSVCSLLAWSTRTILVSPASENRPATYSSAARTSPAAASLSVAGQPGNESSILVSGPPSAAVALGRASGSEYSLADLYYSSGTFYDLLCSLFVLWALTYYAGIRQMGRYPDRSEERRVGKECRSRWS